MANRQHLAALALSLFTACGLPMPSEDGPCVPLDMTGLSECDFFDAKVNPSVVLVERNCGAYQVYSWLEKQTHYSTETGTTQCKPNAWCGASAPITKAWCRR